MKCVLATCVRNEGPYILEWVIFHRILGFENIIIFSNDNDDGSDFLLKALSERRIIDWRPRKLAENESPQLSAYESLSKELFESTEYTDDDYLAWFDCDEFLVLKFHKNIVDLLNYYGKPDALLINWKHFGSSKKISYEKEFTIDRFLYCDTKNSMNKSFKSISKINKNLYSRIENHRPIARCSGVWGRIQYSNDLGNENSVIGYQIPIEPLLRGKAPRNFYTVPFFHEVCHLNHYAIRSWEEYLWKAARGNGRLAVSAEQLHFRKEYFREHDLNNDYDDYASLKYSAQLKKSISELPRDLLDINAEVIDNCLLFYKSKDLSNGQDYGVKRYVEQNSDPILFLRSFLEPEPWVKYFNLDQKNGQIIRNIEDVSISGVLVPKKQTCKSMFLISEKLEFKVKMNISSPLMHKKFPNLPMAKTARFSVDKFRFEIGRVYFLMAFFEEKNPCCLAEISIR